MYPPQDNKGFSLLELLFVVIIIGILASLILAVIDSSKDKAKDTRIFSSIKEIKPFSEEIYTEENGYTNLCNDTTRGIEVNHPVYGQELSIINNEVLRNEGDIICYAREDDYCIFSNLNISVNQWFCIDSTGKAGVVTTDPSNTCKDGSYSCP